MFDDLVMATQEKLHPSKLEGLIAGLEAESAPIKDYLFLCYDKNQKFHVSRKFVESEFDAEEPGDQEVTAECLQEIVNLAKYHHVVKAKSKSQLKEKRQEIALRSIAHRHLLNAVLAKTGLVGIGKSAVKNHVDIYEFEVMRGVTYADKLVKELPVFIEPKHDGMRVELRMKDGFFQILSREGFDVKSLEHLKPSLINQTRADVEALGLPTDNFVVECEGVAGDHSFDDSMSQLGSSNDANNVKFLSFCYLTLDEFEGKTKVTMNELRNRQLEARSNYLDIDDCAVDIEPLPSVIAETLSDIRFHYERFREMGLEGAIVKQPNMPYKNSKNKGWLKLKPKETIDVRVLDVVEGQGEIKGKAGAFIVDYKGVRVNVGSGLTNITGEEDELTDLSERPYSDRLRIWKHKEEYIGNIIEISFMEETKDGSLRHPAFERPRFDKNTVSYS